MRSTLSTTNSKGLVEKIQRDFLLRGEALKKKPHFVKYSTICEDKKKGGLGIQDMLTLNKASLGK